jgi:hypothetical protein
MAIDLVVLAARLFARPTAAMLGIEERTPARRRAQLLGEITGDDLVLRHLARSALWGVMLVLTAPVLIAVAVVVGVFIGGFGAELAWMPLLFPFWMGALHLLQMLIAAYLIGSRWDPTNRLTRWLMLGESVDVVVALAVTVTLQFVDR